jgi:hypothetical protein
LIPQNNSTTECYFYDPVILDHELLAIGDLILTEVLQGFDNEQDFNNVRKLLISLTVVELGGQEIAIQAARNFRALRRLGVTVRKTIDTVTASRADMNCCITTGISIHSLTARCDSQAEARRAIRAPAVSARRPASDRRPPQIPAAELMEVLLKSAVVTSAQPEPDVIVEIPRIAQPAPFVDLQAGRTTDSVVGGSVFDGHGDSVSKKPDGVFSMCLR